MRTIEGTQPTPIEDLAATCIGGDRGAGVELVRRLWATGEHPTVSDLLRIAVPAGRPTVLAFDALADALVDAIDDAAWRRELEQM